MNLQTVPKALYLVCSSSALLCLPLSSAPLRSDHVVHHVCGEREKGRGKRKEKAKEEIRKEKKRKKSNLSSRVRVRVGRGGTGLGILHPAHTCSGEFSPRGVRCHRRIASAHPTVSFCLKRSRPLPLAPISSYPPVRFRPSLSGPYQADRSSDLSVSSRASLRCSAICLPPWL